MWAYLSPFSTLTLQETGLYVAVSHPACPLFLIGTKVSLGALGDSFYEYLLKVWMQGGRSEDNYRRMYDEAMDGVDKLLVQKVGQQVDGMHRTTTTYIDARLHVGFNVFVNSAGMGG